MRLFIALWIALTWTLSPAVAQVGKYEIRIVTADRTEVHERAAESLLKVFPNATRTPDLRSAKRKGAIYLAVGPNALRSLMATPDLEGIVLSLLTSSLVYRSVTETKMSRVTVSGVFADPAPATQLKLIWLLNKRSVRTAVLYSAKSEYLLPTLRKAASDLNMALSVERVESAEDINRALNKVAGAAALLAVPDGSIYNADNIRNILITTYRSDQYLIGFSPSMVQVGSLATSQSSMSDTAEQLRELVAEIETTGTAPEPQFPKYFDVLINDAVARSLNVVVDEAVRGFSRRPAKVQN